MGNRRNPNEIPKKKLIKQVQNSDKCEFGSKAQHTQTPINSFWLKLINK